MRLEWLRRLLQRGRLDADIEEEIPFHLAQEAQLRLDRGEAPEQARVAARRDFGNVLLIKETTRDMWGARWLDDFARDARYALRGLKRSPALAAVAILSLAQVEYPFKLRISPSFPETVGLSLVAGRTFTDADNRDVPKVALVSESIARRYYGTTGAVGRRLCFSDRFAPDCAVAIVGVVKDVHYSSLRESSPYTIYVPVDADGCGNSRGCDADVDGHRLAGRRGARAPGGQGRSHCRPAQRMNGFSGRSTLCGVVSDLCQRLRDPDQQRDLRGHTEARAHRG